MMLICLRSLHREYSRKNVAALFPDLLVAWAVIADDDRGLSPVSISRLARLTGIPRANVRRTIEPLVRQGLVIRKDGGIARNRSYAGARIEATYFKRLKRTIITAGKLLQQLDANG